MISTSFGWHDMPPASPHTPKVDVGDNRSTKAPGHPGAPHCYNNCHVRNSRPSATILPEAIQLFRRRPGSLPAGPSWRRVNQVLSKSSTAVILRISFRINGPATSGIKRALTFINSDSLISSKEEKRRRAVTARLHFVQY
jgi:hypothetical protein